MMNIEVIKNNETVPEEFDYDEWKTIAKIVILAYYNLLTKWRRAFLSASNKGTYDYRYVEGFKKHDHVWNLYYRFMNGSKEERLAMKNEIDKIEQRLYKYRRSCITCLPCGEKRDSDSANSI